MQCTPVLPSLNPAHGVWNGESQDGPTGSLRLTWVWCRAVPHTAPGETNGLFPEKAIEKITGFLGVNLSFHLKRRFPWEGCALYPSLEDTKTYLAKRPAIGRN